jgi:hypothetical protein
LLLCGAPAAWSQAPQDIVIPVIASGPGPDHVGIAYNRKLPDEQLRQDIAAVASNLKIGPPRVKLRSSGRDRLVEAELTGLTDWKTGAVNVDPILQAYRRYGNFRVLFMFLGEFPMPAPRNVDEPPLRVEMKVQGSVIDYRITIDQSNGVPGALPMVARVNDSAGQLTKLIGLIAMAVIVAISVFLILNVVMGQRRGGRAARVGAGQGDGSVPAGRAPEGKP